MLTRRQSLLLATFWSAAPAYAFDLNKALGAAKGAAAAASLSDADVQAHSRQMAAHMDGQARIAPDGSPYARRLAALTASARDDKGLALNYKVYQTRDVNAFALADGSIRLYSGLMDLMTDDEIRYVIGHEIGHVHSGHSRKRLQVALSTGALRDAAGAAGGTAAALSQSQLGELVTQVVRAQHSQSNENEADDYAMGFLSRRGHDRKAAVSALEKLDKLSGGRDSSWLSTHPAPKDRAQRMRQQLA
ncbi:MAG: M48 family metalloprotease [Rubrivivax sp.]|nr:M48 family metalloprotease [Rubrivivax sp.]